MKKEGGGEASGLVELVAAEAGSDSSALDNTVLLRRVAARYRRVHLYLHGLVRSHSLVSALATFRPDMTLCCSTTASQVLLLERSVPL